jgi:hypothetical protein
MKMWYDDVKLADFEGYSMKDQLVCESTRNGGVKTMMVFADVNSKGMTFTVQIRGDNKVQIYETLAEAIEYYNNL